MDIVLIFILGIGWKKTFTHSFLLRYMKQPKFMIQRSFPAKIYGCLESKPIDRFRCYPVIFTESVFSIFATIIKKTSFKYLNIE